MLSNVVIKNYNGYALYISEFKDLNSFLQAITDENINDIFINKFASVNGSFNFTQTSSFKEAWDLCRFSWDDGFDNFYNLFRKVNYIFAKDYVTERDFLPVGYLPNIPRYLKGIPTSMYAYKKVEATKVLNIYMQIGYNCYQTKEQIINRGILTLNLINYLESNSIKVNFLLISASIQNNEIAMIKIPLKNTYEKLNLKKCYFPIVHPSFLRRLCFRAKELMPLTDEEWSRGYGRALGFKEVDDILEHESFNTDYIYISTPEELNIYGENLLDDLENFITSLNNDYGLEKKLKL